VGDDAITESLVIASDDPLLLRCMRSMLDQAAARLRVVAEVTGFDNLVKQVIEDDPDAALVGFKRAADTVRAIAALHVTRPTIRIAAWVTDDAVDSAGAFLRAGATTLVRSTAKAAEATLVSSVVGAVRAPAATDFPGERSPAPGGPVLTPRETEVLALLARGAHERTGRGRAVAQRPHGRDSPRPHPVQARSELPRAARGGGPRARSRARLTRCRRAP
jgi:DNA-binding NarL/FixJ family response regulator